MKRTTVDRASTKREKQAARQQAAASATTAGRRAAGGWWPEARRMGLALPTGDQALLAISAGHADAEAKLVAGEARRRRRRPEANELADFTPDPALRVDLTLDNVDKVDVDDPEPTLG